MSDVFLLSRQQLNRIKPYFPVSHGIPRVDDLRVVSGIIYVIRYGLQWKDAPTAYGPYKTLYRQRHKIEIMFGRIKDWRRIAMRYDRCAPTFFSTICLAATVIFYLKE